jgi:hypothetical protein
MWSLRDVAIFIGVAVFFSFLLLNALLMLFSPRKAVQFRNWWTRADRFSRPNPEWKPKNEWGLRLGGLGLTAMGTYVLVLIALHLVHPAAVAHAPVLPSGTPASSMGWISVGWLLLTNGALLVLGIFAIGKPRRCASLIRNKWLADRLPVAVTPAELLLLRLLGAGAVCFAVWNFVILGGK